MARSNFSVLGLILTVAIGFMSIPNSAEAAAALPLLSDVTVSPNYLFIPEQNGPSYSNPYTKVGNKTTLSATVTNPNTNSPVTLCEYTTDGGTTWLGKGGVYANSICSFSNLALPADKLLNLNIRACNEAGCRESPKWISAKVEKDTPRLIKGLGDGKTSYTIANDFSSLSPAGRTITFSKILSDDCKAKIEAALQAAADHPFAHFNWSDGTNLSPNPSVILVGNPSASVVLSGDVIVDLVDRVGNMTKRVRIVDSIDASAVAALPQISDVVVSPGYFFTPESNGPDKVSGYLKVGNKTNLDSAVIKSGGSAVTRCEYTFDGGKTWKNAPQIMKTKSSIVNLATCSVNTPLPANNPLILNIRACNKEGCRESPKWITAQVEKDPPKLLKALGTGKSPFVIDNVGSLRSVNIPFSKILSDDCKAKIEASLKAAADRPLNRLAWKEGSEIYLNIGATPGVVTTLYGDIVLDLVDRVGNTTKNVRILDSIESEQASLLPRLSPFTMGPSYVYAPPSNGPEHPRPYTKVGIKTTFEAAITNPNASFPVTVCEYSFDEGKTWRVLSKPRDASGLSSCSAQISLPTDKMLTLNIRACNKIGCRESSNWVSAQVEKDTPKLLKGLGDGKTAYTIANDFSSLSPAGRTITFTKILSDDTKSKIEAVLQAAADHPFARFNWSDGTSLSPSPSVTLVGNPAFDIVLKGDVFVDLVDRVGNTTSKVRLVDNP